MRHAPPRNYNERCAWGWSQSLLAVLFVRDERGEWEFDSTNKVLTMTFAEFVDSLHLDCTNELNRRWSHEARKALEALA